MKKLSQDNKSYTIKSIADTWNVSKSTIQRLIQSLDAEYLKQHTHTARNRTIIDAEMYQRLYNIYHSESQQTESKSIQTESQLHQSESDMIHQIELELMQTKSKLHQTESQLHQIESLYQNQINDLRADKEKLNEQLAAKDEQIKELQKLLDQEQQLHKQTKDQYQLLLVDKEEPERKGFFKRLFRK